MSEIWQLQQDARTNRIVEAKDAAHFQLLRVREAARGRGRLIGKVAGVGVATSLLLVMLTGGADAGSGPAAKAGAVAATQPTTRMGTAMAETMVGGAEANRLNAGAGPDVLLGNGGNDSLVGGVGDDVVQGGAGNDVLWAGPGRDVLIGGAGDDQLHAESFDGSVDRLHCGEGEDTAWIVSVNGKRPDQVFGCEHINVTSMQSVTARR